MPADITVQLYSVREQANADYEGTIRAIAAMGFRKVEPAGFPGSTPEAAAKLFKELGLEAPSCHCGLPIGDQKQQVIETALTMGHKYLITGCPPKFKEHYTSADGVKAMAALYCEAAANAAEHGLQVGYHNHDWDLIDVDGTPGYQIFLAETPDSVLYEADIFWVSRAGRSPAEFITEIGVRGKCLHFKDGKVNTDGEFVEAETEDGKIMISNDKPFMPAGTGEVDLAGAFAAAEHAELIAVELDSYNGDMMAAVKQSYDFLTAQGYAIGAK